MDAEITQLEAQLEQLISLYAGLRAENRDLHGRMLKLEAENHALSDKVKRATDKLEAVLEKLPLA